MSLVKHMMSPVELIFNYSFHIISASVPSRGTESEIQLPLKRFPDSSVTSLIPTGWCERASHHQKLVPTFPGIERCLMVIKMGFSQNVSVTMTKQDVLKCC